MLKLQSTFQTNSEAKKNKKLKKFFLYQNHNRYYSLNKLHRLKLQYHKHTEKFIHTRKLCMIFDKTVRNGSSKSILIKTADSTEYCLPDQI